MSYNIYKSDGSAIIIPDGTVSQNFNNSAANSGKGIGVQIVGLTSTNYVIPTAQNFLQITENFCSSILPPDNKALQGQLWFNKLSPTTGNLYVRIAGSPVGGLANWREVVVGDTSVIPGSYTAADITVDAQGRITSAANGIGGGGSVLSVSITTANGVSGVVATPTTTPAITLTLGAITPTSVAASGTVTGSNLSGTSSGTNTGDQTITLTGAVTGSGTGSFAVTYNGVVPILKGGTGQTTANASLNALLPSQTSQVGKVLQTDGTNTSWQAFPGTGSVTNVGVNPTNGVTASVANPTTTPVITIGLGAITPTSVAASGTVTGSNLSGTNTGDQTLNSLLPSQPGNAGKVLSTDGSNASWSDDNTGFVPYYIPVLTTFIVPLYKQALFSIPIINDGTIIVDGYLVGV